MTLSEQTLPLGARHSDGAHLVDHRPYERHRSGALPAMSFIQFAGSAIIEQMDATTLMPPGWSARVDRWLDLILEANTP